MSFSGAPPSANFTWGSNFSFNNSSEDAPFEANMKYADENNLDLYAIELAAGRAYTNKDSAAVLINETMRRKLG